MALKDRFAHKKGAGDKGTNAGWARASRAASEFLGTHVRAQILQDYSNLNCFRP